MIRARLSLLGILALLASCSASAGEKILYQTHSAYNQILVTEDGRGLRTLWFEEGGARQSVVKPGDPDHVELRYARLMTAGLAFVEEPKRVLIVGLGGGTIPMFLHKHYPRTQIDVVEIDPAVVETAKAYFGFRESDSLRAYAEDGRRFIERCRQPYEVIFLDAFGPENIPYDLTTREFLQSVRRALAPNGVALANIWRRESNDLHDSMVRTYQEVFEDLHILKVPKGGNEILAAFPSKQSIELDRLVRRARQISQEKQLPFDLGYLIEHSYRRA